METVNKNSKTCVVLEFDHLTKILCWPKIQNIWVKKWFSFRWSYFNATYVYEFVVVSTVMFLAQKSLFFIKKQFEKHVVTHMGDWNKSIEKPIWAISQIYPEGRRSREQESEKKYLTSQKRNLFLDSSTSFFFKLDVVKRWNINRQLAHKLFFKIPICTNFFNKFPLLSTFILVKTETYTSIIASLNLVCRLDLRMHE